MSYTPTTWHGGDVLSAEAMNKIENGIANAGSGALEVQVSGDENGAVMDKTWQEIYDAFPNVYCVAPAPDMGKSNIFSVYNENNSYVVDSGGWFQTDSPDGYPTASSTGPTPSDGGNVNVS